MSGVGDRKVGCRGKGFMKRNQPFQTTCNPGILFRLEKVEVRIEMVIRVRKIKEMIDIVYKMEVIIEMMAYRAGWKKHTGRATVI